MYVYVFVCVCVKVYVYVYVYLYMYFCVCVCMCMCMCVCMCMCMCVYVKLGEEGGRVRGVNALTSCAGLVHKSLCTEDPSANLSISPRRASCCVHFDPCSDSSPNS